MTASRKLYVAIATELADVVKAARCNPDARDSGAQVAVLTMAINGLCDALESDNPAFDRDRFLKAAGVSQ